MFVILTLRKTKEAWAKAIFDDKIHEHLFNLKARVYLRKEQRPITAHAVEVVRNRAFEDLQLVPGDIQDALSRGEEVRLTPPVNCTAHSL